MRTLLTRRDCLKVLGTTLVTSSVGEAVAQTGSRVAPRPEADETMRGIFIILSTPYTASKAIDYDDLAAEVEWLNEAGVHGLVWPQNSSDYSQLKKEEIMRGMEVITRANKGKRSALVLGVQQDDVRGMVELAAHAEKLGPTAMIAMPPKVAKSLADYREYYTELAKLTSRPVILQTVPNPPGIEYSLDDRIRSKPGKMLILADAHRRWYDSNDKAPDAGTSVVLTLDENIQYIA